MIPKFEHRWKWAIFIYDGKLHNCKQYGICSVTLHTAALMISIILYMFWHKSVSEVLPIWPFFDGRAVTFLTLVFKSVCGFFFQYNDLSYGDIGN